MFDGDEGTRDSEFSVCQTLSCLRLTSRRGLFFRKDGLSNNEDCQDG